MHMIGALTALKALGGKLLGNWYAVTALVGVVAIYLILVVLPQRANTQGQQQGQLACVATGASAAVTHTVSAAASAASQAGADISRTNAIGTQHERVRTRIETIYRTLDIEASHATPHPVDACVLPPDRLRIWAAANAGPDGASDPADQGAAIGQPDPATTAPAASNVGADTRSGDQPPGSGSGIPSTGGPALQPAHTSGD